MQHCVAHAAYQQLVKLGHMKNASLNRLKTHRHSDTQSPCRLSMPLHHSSSISTKSLNLICLTVLVL